MRARGADFSSFQDNAAVQAAIAHGLTFAFVKLTEGVSYANPRAVMQHHLLQSNGAKVGYYHFCSPHADGAAQWDYFERHIAERPGPVAVDHERDAQGVMPADAIVRAFIRRGQQRGYKVGRYGSGEVMQHRRLGEDWRWVAWWAPSAPPFAWDVWQFAGSGSQDWNVFRGDTAALAAWWPKVSQRKSATPPARWWFHDDLTKASHGPYRLPRLAAALVGYLARHPRSLRLTLERK